MNKYRVIHNRRTTEEIFIQVRKDDLVICGERSNPDGDWPGWIYCTINEISGWIPEMLIDIQDNHGRMTEDYDAREFNLMIGETLTGKRELNGWIWCYKENEPSFHAWAPLNHLERI